MNELTGISPDATRFQSLSETGDAAQTTSLNNGSIYENAIKQSYLDRLPTDQNDDNAPKLRSSDAQSSANLGGIYDRFTQTSDSFEVGMTEVFSVLHEAAVSLRKSMKDARSAEREVQQTQLQDAADKLKNAATFSMVSGIVGGSMQAIGGAVSIGGAASSAKTVFGGKGVTTADVNDQPKANDVSQMPIETRIQLAQQMSAKWTGASQVISGAGQAAAAVFDAQAKFQESEKATIDAKATKTQQAVEDSNQLVQDLAEMVRDVRAKLAEIENANNETIRKTLQV